MAQIFALQEEAGGFTELVQLPVVYVEVPIWRKGRVRSGASYTQLLRGGADARGLPDCTASSDPEHSGYLGRLRSFDHVPTRASGPRCTNPCRMLSGHDGVIL